VIRRNGTPKEFPTPLATHTSAAALLSLFLSHILKYYSVEIPITRSNVGSSASDVCGKAAAPLPPTGR
jgi:hypothetical protein